MKVIDTLSDLTTAELGRIRQTLFARFGIKQRGNIVEVGFGVAERGGQIDSDRLDAICFYVSTKRLPRAKVDRIPVQVEVRVKRGRHFVLARFPTDVIEISRNTIQLTGRPIRHVADRSQATAGAILVWRFGAQRQFAYGVLTVGHLFWNRDQVPEEADDVRIGVAGGREILGRLIVRSQPGQGVDAAVILSSRRALIEGGVLRESAGTKAKRIRAIDRLVADRMQSGVTLPRGRAIPFIVLRYLPELDLLPALGPISHALEVHSSGNGAFRKGTSGALWIIQRQAACHQFAGWRTDDPKQSFTRGAGQSLSTVLKWCRHMLARTYRKRVSDTELRLIREL